MSRLLVRASLVVALAGLTLAAPASATRVRPSELVLRQADVPAHYLLDRDNTMAITYAQLVRRREAPEIMTTSGLVAGYITKYRNTDPPRWRDISSVAYLFRRPQGAASYLAWMKHALEHQNGPKFRRNPTAIGAEGWVYTARSLDTGTLVLWRYGRVVALLACQEMTSHRSLAVSLARKQQRRIAGALR
jgi:hypothetical protein